MKTVFGLALIALVVGYLVRSKLRRRAEISRYRDFVAAAFVWIAEYGSTRLKMIAGNGLLEGSIALYLEERVTMEMYGWHYYAFEPHRYEDDYETFIHQGRNKSDSIPTVKAMQMMEHARQDGLDPHIAYVGDIPRAGLHAEGPHILVALYDIDGRKVPIWRRVDDATEAKESRLKSV